MSLLSERRLARHENKVRHDPKPVPHHILIEQAREDVVKQTHMMGLENLLVDTVLQLDLCTRKIMSVALEGHNKLVMKADTLVQLRSSHYDHEEFVEAFHNVHMSSEVANYRNHFAKFLATASAIKKLQGDERRTFERRLRDGEHEEISETSEKDTNQRSESMSTRQSKDSERQDTNDSQAQESQPGSDSADAQVNIEMTDPRHEDIQHVDSSQEDNRADASASERRRHLKSNVLQSKGLVDTKEQEKAAHNEYDS